MMIAVTIWLKILKIEPSKLISVKIGLNCINLRVQFSSFFGSISTIIVNLKVNFHTHGSLETQLKI